jgi:hypothetical protein
MNKTPDSDLESRAFLFLDDLRESGVTNMYGAGPYVETYLGCSRRVAGELLVKWMETFEARHLDKSHLKE